MSDARVILTRAGAVEIGGRALVIEGPPGSGKSSLALTLIDRGARLIGDDAVTIERRGDRVIASPPPNITGLIEVRGVGLAEIEPGDPAPIALILTLGGDVPERMPQPVATRDVLGCALPVLGFDPGTIAAAPRAEWALRLHGLAHA